MGALTNKLTKKEQRKFYSEIRDQIGESRRTAAADSLSKILLPDVEAILSFVSMRSELCSHLLNIRLCREGRLLLPKWSASGLTTHRVTDLNTLVRNPRGFLEPKGGEIEFPILVVTPGLAFDQQYHRLGYGGGAYDRFFAAHPNLLRWGVAFEEQRTMRLPHEAHDIPMHQCFFY